MIELYLEIETVYCCKLRNNYFSISSKTYRDPQLAICYRFNYYSENFQKFLNSEYQKKKRKKEVYDALFLSNYLSQIQIQIQSQSIYFPLVPYF